MILLKKISLMLINNCIWFVKVKVDSVKNKSPMMKIKNGITQQYEVPKTPAPIITMNSKGELKIVYNCDPEINDIRIKVSVNIEMPNEEELVNFVSDFIDIENAQIPKIISNGKPLI